ncbi:AAA family ATPase [Nostoc sp.]|uniref:AAA family ATPase n=1 Tax=Nostoc sp. TaxID=1180 RepID=UPI002FFB03F6
MLKRIYIDNFRGLVNFEMNFDSINLFLGGNGTGKSSVFEVLRKIQLFISGDDKVEGIFKSADCTRWQTSPVQRFELEIAGNGGSYKYEFAIRHNQEKSHVEYERLWFNNQALLKSEEGEIKIFQDDYEEVVKTSLPSRFQLVGSLLYLFTVDSATKLDWFTKRMQRFIIVQIIPSLMLNRGSLDENAPPSLQAACEELQRLLPLLNNL